MNTVDGSVHLLSGCVPLCVQACSGLGLRNALKHQQLPCQLHQFCRSALLLCVVPVLSA
jgi:hypothetical protein